MWKKQLCRHQGQRRRERRYSRHRSRSAPAACDEDHGEAGCRPAVHGGPRWNRDPLVARGRDLTPDQVDARRRLWHRGKPRAGAGSFQDLQTCGERSPCPSKFAVRACDPMGDPRWSSLFLKDCTPWEGPTLGQFVKSCSPWEGLMLKKFVEDCLPGEGPDAGAWAECEESSSWGGRSGRDNVWWTDRNPHYQSPCAAWGEEVENTGVKLSLGRMEGWVEGVL